MRLLVDTHTHTVVSGHAFSTLLENLDFAAKRGLEGIVTSEHSEKVPGVQPNFTIRIQNCFPKEYNGVRIIKGAEVNSVKVSTVRVSSEKGRRKTPLQTSNFAR